MIPPREREPKVSPPHFPSKFRGRHQAQFPLRTVPQLSSQVLTDGILGDFGYKDHPAAELFIRSEALLDKLLDLLLGHLRRIGHDICPRKVAAGVVGQIDADHGGFLDLGVSEEQILDFGGRHLEAFILEEFLQDSVWSLGFYSKKK